MKLLPGWRGGGDVEVPSAEAALAFLSSGVRPPGVSAREFVRACLKVREFKEKAWPHFVCFVDASNVARRRPVAVHEVTAPKARLADLDAVVAALRTLRYVPFVVSDGNLFHLIDEPYEWKRKYSEYPHSVAERRQADSIVLRALRKLPEAACVTNDRFAKPDELRDFGDVLALEGCFFRHHWEGDTPSFVSREGGPMPDAISRLAARLDRLKPA